MMRGIFPTSFMKNLPAIQEIWRNHWNVDSAHCLDKMNIWHKFHENPTRGLGDMWQTQNINIWMFTSDLTSLKCMFCTKFWYAHQLTQIPKKKKKKKKNTGGLVDIEWTQKLAFELRPLNLTLTQHHWNVDSAHHLNTLNIWPMFKDNPIRILRDMKWTHEVDTKITI